MNWVCGDLDDQRRVGIVTESARPGRILDVRTDRLRSRLSEGQVVVVAGFQGTSQQRRNRAKSPPWVAAARTPQRWPWRQP